MRIAYIKHETFLKETDALIVKRRGGGEKVIKPDKWWKNRNTEVGEDADLWERKPYNGRKYIFREDIIAVEREENEKV